MPLSSLAKRLRQRIYRSLERWDGYRDRGDQLSARRVKNVGQSPTFFYRRSGAPVDIANLWSDRGIFLIANGPSLKTVDLNVLKRPGILTVGMNNGVRVFRPHLWVSIDEPFRFVEDIWSDPSILKFTPFSNMELPLWDARRNTFSTRVAGESPGVLGFHRNAKFSEDTFLVEDTINWGNHPELGSGRSVLLATLRILHILGFRRVYVLGLDFEMTGADPYAFDETRNADGVRINNSSYATLTGFLTKLKPVFDRAGFVVYNLNRTSRLTVFPYLSLEEALAREEVDVSAPTRGMYDRVPDRGPK